MTRNKWLACAAVWLASLILIHDAGVLVTEAAVLPMFASGRGVWLRHLLLISWAAAAVEYLSRVPMAGAVFSYAVMDFIIAGAALARLTHDPGRIDARLVGGLSIALMPAHLVMSASHGQVNWTWYAASCNAAFVLQCLIIGGWTENVELRLRRFAARLHPVRLFRRRVG